LSTTAVLNVERIEAAGAANDGSERPAWDAVYVFPDYWG